MYVSAIRKPGPGPNGSCHLFLGGEGQICAVPSQQYSVTHLRLIKKWWKGVSGESMSFGSLCQATLIRLKILSKGLFADAKLDDNLGAKASLSDELHAKTIKYADCEVPHL